jgi:hypothetical protein
MVLVKTVIAAVRLARMVLPAVCVALTSVSCSGHSAGFTDAGKFTKTPDSCALMPPDVVGRLTGAAVAGERVDDKAMAVVQECSWFNVADPGHPNAKFGQVAVFVQRGRASSMGNAVQSTEKAYRKELNETGCTRLSGLAVDESCVFPGSGGRLVAFRTSNLFVRVTCSVRNPDVCSGAQRPATAQLLAKTVLQKL